MTQAHLFFDFETFLIQPGCTAPPIVCMSFAIDQGAPQLLHALDPRTFKLLDAALRTPGVVMVAHYAAYEALCMMAHHYAWVPLIAAKVDAGEYRCTLAREKLLRTGKGNHNEGFALDECLDGHRIQHTMNKASPWRVRFGTLYGKPIELWPGDAIAYSLEDVSVRELYWAQAAEGAEYFVNEIEQVQAEISLAATSAWGFMTDGETAAVLVEETRVRLAQYTQDLLCPVDGSEPLLRYEVEKGYPKAVRNTAKARERCERVYLAMGREPPRGKVSPTMLMAAYANAGISDRGPQWTSEQKDRIKITAKMLEEAAEDGCEPADLIGNISVDKDACYLSRDPLLQAYSAYGQADTLLGKALRPVIAAEAGKPIQCSYNHMVNTGRSSCRQGEDPEPGEGWTSIGMQVQNLPRAGELVEVEVS